MRFNTVLATLSVICMSAMVSASQIMPGEEAARFLQTLGANFTSTCTTDSNCNTAQGHCCADYRRTNGTTLVGAVRTCFSALLNNQTFAAAGFNHSFTCVSQPGVASIAANLGTTCQTNSTCNTTAGQCCLQRSIAAWGVSQVYGSTCADTSRATQSWIGYNVANGTTFTLATNVTYSAACYTAPVVTNNNTNTGMNNTGSGNVTSTSSASFVQVGLTFVVALLSVVLAAF